MNQILDLTIFVMSRNVGHMYCLRHHLCMFITYIYILYPHGLKDIVNLYFTKFAVICLSPSISPSNQHINGCFILTENWYALPMVFFLLLGTQNKMTRYHILKYFGQEIFEIYPTCTEYTHDF